MTSLTEQSVSTPMNYSLVDPSDLTMQAVLQLARNCEYEVQHSHQVTFLALRLFDELKTLHQLGDRERRWLEYAGILHDIGWIEGWKGHHKATLRIILTTPTLLF
ncbi:MAG: HD domain-containing protein, partial [Anaerolineaceae bacterium]|nr:HD domain-containing protein [Anaerolineaceae bacterium]